MAQTGFFLYGIVPGDVETTADAYGVGDPPGRLQAVRHGDLAMLVSEISLDQPLGRPADLTAYQQLLDDTALVAPVLPVRFGSVVAGSDTVVELLSTHADSYRAALGEFEGRVEYLVQGRYDEERLVSTLLAENPAVEQLAAQVRGQPEEVSRNERIQLGQLISQAVEQRRAADNQQLIDALAQMVVRGMVRSATHEHESVHVAFLVELDRQDEFVDAVGAVAEQWREHARLRLLGPLAPYDFVEIQQAEGA